MGAAEPTWIRSFVANRCVEIRENYESLRVIEITRELLNRASAIPSKRPNEAFWHSPRDYLRLQAYQLGRACLKNGEAWIDALLARTPGKHDIRGFRADPFRLIIMAVEPTASAANARRENIRAKHKLDKETRIPLVRLNPSTRARLISDLMIAHKNDVPVKHLIGFLRQLGEEPSKALLAKSGEKRAAFRQRRANSMRAYFKALRATYNEKPDNGAVEVIEAAPLSGERLKVERVHDKRAKQAGKEGKHRAISRPVRPIDRKRRKRRSVNPDS